MLRIGHRGWRGNFPENSILACQEALKLGIDGIEIDVVVNGDGQLVVSHEPWMNPEICEFGSQNDNIYQLTQQEISVFDCGMKLNHKFPHQKKIPTTKPLFSDLILQLDLDNKTLLLEIKSLPEGDHLYHPPPEAYAQIIISELEEVESSCEVFIMSFDHRVLDEIQNLKEIKTIFLTENIHDVPKENYTGLGISKDIASKKLIRELKSKDQLVFIWTVNDWPDIKEYQNLDIDAIISDYPNRLLL